MDEKSENKIAVLLKVVAVIVYIGGSIASFVVSGFTFYYPDSEEVGLLLLYLASSIIIGSLLLGISEIIKLLHNLRKDLQTTMSLTTTSKTK